MQIFVFVCVFMIFGLVIAYTRTKTLQGTTMGSKTLTIHSNLPVAEAYKRLCNGVGKFAVADANESRQAVLLTTKPTFATWGFFYPVFIVQSQAGCQLTVGIRSRLFQVGPLVTRAHKECVAAIEIQLGSPSIGQDLPSAQVV